ncbi:MAG: VOC family protein [Anaerolineales bacterium]|nr:MAG: VOC family protein [Anaerolineales bacterium]
MELTHTRLLVNDIETCRAFYAETLGLGEPAVKVEGIYYEFVAGPGRLGLYARELMQSVGGVAQKARSGDQAADKSALTFRVADVDAAYAELKGRGANFVTEPHNQDAWVLRVAHLRDPEGNLIEINASLSS